MPEVWMRGPIDGVPPLLQPVAHALLQAEEEITALLYGFPDELLWISVANRASVGFHLQHMTGVLDRMSTYARGLPLTEQQFHYLRSEGQPDEDLTVLSLCGQFFNRLHRFIDELRQTDETTLLQPRGVGRQQLPTTVLGLLFHAAEHTQRHLGQLVVTVSVVSLIYR